MRASAGYAGLTAGHVPKAQAVFERGQVLDSGSINGPVGVAPVTSAVADPPAHATRSWSLGGRDGAVCRITSRERSQPILITKFARLTDSVRRAAGMPR